MASQTGLQFTMRLDGVGDDVDLAVTDFLLEEALSEPFTLAVRFASRHGDLDPADVLDRPAGLTIWQDGQALRRVNGVVSEFACGDSGHRRTFYDVQIRPAFWRLGQTHDSRIFQNVTPQAVIQQLCEAQGIAKLAFALTRNLPEREYLVQYRESDRAFIERLAAEEGIFYYHQADGDDHELIFADDPQMLPTLGERLYHSRTGGTPVPGERRLRRLRQVSRVRPSSVTMRDHSFRNPDYDQEHDRQADGLEQHGQRDAYEHYDYPGRYKHDASGRAFTRVRLEQLRREAVTVEAEGDLPELQPGTRFTLTGHDVARLNRDWQVVSVAHEGTQPQALEEDAGEGLTSLHTKRLLLVPGDRAWRPTPNPRPRIDGPQVATVAGPAGEEIHCDEFGRVRVEFPWCRDGAASAWLRVAQGWAGAGYGMFALPRVGHAVFVSYLEGDPDQPYVSGSAYHAVNTPPYVLPEHKTRTTIKTQTHKGQGFNELCFEDKAGEEFIYLHAQKNLDVHVENSHQKRVEFDDTATIGNNSYLAVAKDRVETVEGSRDVSVAANLMEKVDGDRGLRVGGACQTLAGGDITLKADGEIVLDAAKITLVSGGAALVVSAGSIDVTPALNVGAASPGAAALPPIPAVLEAAAGEGSPFVSHCPQEEA